MKEKCVVRERHYRKNTLKKRIARTMRFSNAISTFIMLILLVLAIGGIVGFLGHNFSSYTAKQMAEEVQAAYLISMNEMELQEAIKADYSENQLMNAADLEDMKLMMMENTNLEDQHEINAAYKALTKLRYFDYVVFVHGERIYDSFEADKSMSNVDRMSRSNELNNQLFEGAEESIMDGNGNVIGSVSVRLSTFVIMASYVIAGGIALIVLIINSIISKILTSVTSRMVSKPLETLAEQMESLANEDLEDAFNAHLEVKRPVSEVDSLMKSSKKIITKMSEYYQTMLAQNQELEAQRDVLADHRDELEAQKDELEAQNEELTVTGDHLQSMNNAYLSRTLKLQNLMDNIGQGFMTFNASLIVNAEYSMVCSTMLCEEGCDHEIQGRKVSELLFNDDPEQQTFLESLLVKIIQGNKHERSLFMPLLPEEINVNKRVQRIEYQIVKDEHFKEQMMVILTDITETRHLENQMSHERDVLQMIVKVLLNRDEFIELVDSFNIFTNEVFDNLQEESYEERLRNIHTFKGGFSQFYMSNVSNMLNVLEDKIYEVETFDAMKEEDVQKMKKALQSDLDMVEAYVGTEFVTSNDLYTIKEEKILEIEDKIRKILPASEFNKILPIIKSIRFKSVKESLRAYPDYVTKLAERIGKSVVPFDIQGDDVFVDFEVYQKVLKSFVHLFRNAVDHGIEDVDARLVAEKNEAAVIECRVDKVDDRTLTITVTDDGRGIDTGKLVVKAIEEGRLTENEAMTITEDGKLNLIFQQGISTKDEATALSGRGVGLAAVQEMVDYIGGTIKVDSIPGKGTTIKISLPIFQGAEIVAFEPEAFIERVEGVAGNYLASLNLPMGEPAFIAEDKITLNRVNALLNIKGSIDGLIIISSNTACSKALVKSFILDDIDDSEMNLYAEDVLGEVTNTIMGNVLGTFEEEGVYLTLGVPVMLSNKSAYVKYANRQIISAKHHEGDYIFTISLLLTDSNDITDVGGYDVGMVLDEFYEGGL